MEDLIARLSSIELKVRVLIDENKQLKKKYNALQVKYDEQCQDIYSKEFKISELENKINVLRISGNISGGKDAVKLKQFITEIEREIDKCIDLLDK